jgi:L-fuconolactonase
MSEKIDAHHHFWSYTQEQYGWIDERMESLRRDFLPGDLQPEMLSAGIDGAVSVQARQSLEETGWLLLMAESRLLKGVVGWAPIASDNFAGELEGLRQFKKLKGLRHVVQDEPDPNFINRPDFNRGIGLLQGTGLVYDILIYERQLPAAIEFVDRHPKQVFVLDHIAKPRIRERALEPWKQNIAEIAARENVYCKLSGMATEADWKSWTEHDLRPYFDVVLESFGPRRIMAGSDWPVCLLATTYASWFATLERLLSALSENEKDRIFGGTAVEAYRLDSASSV